MEKYFYCYSKHLCLFLKLQDIDYIAKEINPNGQKPYYKFVRDDKLNRALTNWEKYKQVFHKEELCDGTNRKEKSVCRALCR